jgi:prepilin-type N-terminal cleavage/methylation domain-containing protein
MKVHVHNTARGAFTLIELMVAMTLLALVVGNVFMILGQTSKAMGSQSVTFETETQVQRTLDRIAMAIVGSSEDTLYITAEAPAFVSSLNYEANLGMENGLAVWSDPRRIALGTAGSGEVTWFENPDTTSERRIIWSKFVPQFLAGEIANGVDDNGNGLIDESGLSFSKSGRTITIHLTISRPGANGEFVTRTHSAQVTCRN